MPPPDAPAQADRPPPDAPAQADRLPPDNAVRPAPDARSPLEVGGMTMAVTKCGDVPPEGRCLSPMELEYCEIPTEDGEESLERVRCVPGEECKVNEDGEAECVLTAACREKDTECQDPNTLRTCTNSMWKTAPCPNGCLYGGGGAACAAMGTTTEVSSKVVFERRTLKQVDRSGIGDIFEAPARGFLVLILRGDALVATTTTSVMDGSFKVKVPSPILPTDQVSIAAVALDEKGDVAYMVGDPGLTPGKRTTEDTDSADMKDGDYRTWEFPLSQIMTPGSTLKIRENADHDSGVANVFDQFGVSYREAKQRFGKEGDPIIIWMGKGVSWDCGACVSGAQAVFYGDRFKQQMWYPAEDRNYKYYADPVIGHEAGHWVMSSYGRSPGEGGSHIINCQSFPGLAWSDGFATWWGQFVVGNPIYFSPGANLSLFWLDIEKRTFKGSEDEWADRPLPSNMDVMTSEARGLLQLISESEVMAVLWALSRGARDPDPILKALASPRVKTPTMVGGKPAFERGYQRHVWKMNGCDAFSMVARTDRPSPILPDLFDAMMCAGFPKARMDEAVQPMAFYPYPSDTPKCRM
jgi:hypothetical protein